MILPLFPLNVVLFPGMLLPLHIFEPRYRQMIGECVAAGSPFGVVFIKDGPEIGGAATPHTVGTAAKITSATSLADGRLNIATVGYERFTIQALHHDQPYLTATVAAFPLAGAGTALAKREAQALAPWLMRYLDVLGEAAATQFERTLLPSNPESLANLVAIVAQIPMEEKQRLLEAPAAVELLSRERALLRREISLMRAMLANPRTHDTKPFTPN